jgi:predicted Zn-dependent protease
MQYLIRKQINFLAKISGGVLLFIIIAIFSPPAKSKGLSLIRDAEIEDFLYDITKPVFKAANLNPDDIHIYIINDSTLNAFVAGGQNVFINTGLITKYTNPNVLIGVIAHETGHIASGHLARSSEDMQNAGNTMLFTYIAGIAAAIVKPDAGMAILMGGSQIAERTALKFNRSQEEAADSLALKYLGKSGNSADGLLELLELFDHEENGYKQQIDEYALTHPVSKKRVNFMKANSAKLSHKINPEFQRRLERIVIKLEAFLDNPDQTLKRHNKNDFNDKYAQTISYYKKGKAKQAIKILDDLITSSPNDNYLYDLKGQILFENGDVKESIIAYNQTIKLNSKNNLARIALASAIINLDSGDKNLTNFAIENLLIAQKTEKSDTTIYQQLAKAYNQNGDLGMSYLVLAEISLLEENSKKVKKYVKLAKENLDKNDKVNLLRLDDIEQFSKKIKDDKKELENDKDFKTR